MLYYTLYIYDFFIVDNNEDRKLVPGTMRIRSMKTEKGDIVHEYKIMNKPCLKDEERRELRGRINTSSYFITVKYEKAIFGITEELNKKLQSEYKRDKVSDSFIFYIGSRYESLKDKRVEGLKTLCCDTREEIVVLQVRGRRQGEIDFSPLQRKLTSMHEDCSWITPETCKSWTYICDQYRIKQLTEKSDIKQQISAFLSSCELHLERK